MKIKIGILTGIVILFCFLTVVLYGNFIPDDTFIHIGFAKDIAAGKGFSFAGNKTFGSTAPLWPLLIALFSFLVGNLETTAKLLSLAFGVCAIGLFFSTAVHRWGVKKGALATLLLSFNPYMLRWAGTGMEATASVFWMTLFLAVLLRKDREYTSRWYYFALGFAPLIRPEFYLVGFLFLLFKLFDRSISFSQILFFFIPIVLWNSFAALYFGTVVPSTFLAKAHDKFFAIEAHTAIRSLKLFLTLNPIELLCIVGTLCFILFFRSSSKKRSSLFDKTNISLFLIIVAIYGYYVLKNVTIISRHILFTLPVMITLAIESLTVIDYNSQFKKIVYSLVLGGLLLYSTIFTSVIVYPDAVRVSKGFQQEYRKIARLLYEQPGNNKSVASSEVGIIGVYSGCKIYDFNGLVDRERFQYSSGEEYVRSKHPDFIITRGEFDISPIAPSEASVEKIYETTFTGMGINETLPVHVTVYAIHWL